MTTPELNPLVIIGCEGVHWSHDQKTNTVTLSRLPLTVTDELFDKARSAFYQAKKLEFDRGNHFMDDTDKIALKAALEAALNQGGENE